MVPPGSGTRVPAPLAPVEPEVEANEEQEPKNVKELLPRKVLLSNVPPMASAKDLSEFFTGAIFTATGHTLSENVKVVELVEMQSGGHAEVLFATALSATIAVALHGINFQNKVLGIRRPPGFSGPPLNRAKLLTVAMKDLVSDLPDTAVPPATAVSTTQPATEPKPSTARKGAKVNITGIPSSMTGASIFDCLQQFGGPLKSLSLTTNRDTGEHNGSGTAEFAEYASAVEACRFSPFFGFIEETPSVSVNQQEAPRRSRWSEEDDVDDLGPFNEVLPPKPNTSMAHFPREENSSTQNVQFEAPRNTGWSDVDDLGPFEEVLRNIMPR
eukprot:symbB.v1.2.005666.t1/scaffold327.1/size259883/19